MRRRRQGVQTISSDFARPEISLQRRKAYAAKHPPHRCPACTLTRGRSTLVWCQSDGLGFDVFTSCRRHLQNEIGPVRVDIVGAWTDAGWVVTSPGVCQNVPEIAARPDTVIASPEVVDAAAKAILSGIEP